MRQVLRLIYCTSAFFVFSAINSAFAGSPEDHLVGQIERLVQQNRQLMRLNEQLVNRVQTLELEIAKIKATRAMTKQNSENVVEEKIAWYERITIGGGATAVVQGVTNNKDTNPKTGDKTDITYTVDLNIGVDLEQYGQFHIHIEGGDGEGLNNDLTSFSVSNYDAYATWNNNNQATLTFSEAFYQKEFWDGKACFAAGKMDISVLFDENQAAGDETAQFLSNIFVKSMGLTIPEPGGFYCPAAMFSWLPADFIELRIIGASVDNNQEENTWENIFSNDFGALQLNLMPNLFNRPGNFRLYGWYDSRRYINSDDLDSKPNTYESGDKNLSGWGISFDQEILDSVTAFARYSWRKKGVGTWNSDEDRWEIIPFDQAYSIGMSIAGKLWDRANDGMGIGFGQTILSREFKEKKRHTANEKYIEIYYRYSVFEHLALSADFQWVINPGGIKDNDDIYIFGLRSQLIF